MARLKKLPNSQLQPEWVIVDSFSFAVRDGFDDRSGSIGVKASIEIAQSQQAERVKISLRLESSRSKTDGAPYDFSLEISGGFAIEPTVDPDRRERLIALNAPSILYGIARGYVASATSMAPAASLQLPSVNLVAALGSG